MSSACRLLPIIASLLISVVHGLAEEPVIPAEESAAPPQPVPAHLELAKKLFDPGLADGFDFPAGGPEGKAPYTAKATRRKYAGWKVTGKPGEADADTGQPHTGEAWNGSGGGTTDAGQPIFAIAAGVVREVKETPRGPAVTIEHRFVENGALRTVWSTSAGLADVTLKAGDPVKRRQPLGTIANRGAGTTTQLYLEIRTQWPPPAEAGPAAGCEPPSAFIRAHRTLTVPAKEKSLIIASKKDYRLLYCRDGKVVEDLPIALSQKPLGPKTEDGDNRTPEGEYRIIQKAVGPFDGEWGKFLGSRWMRINYPNAHDARTALDAGRINKGKCEAILAANAAGKMPLANSELGGGVGIHGWVSDWPDGPQNLTWGCLSLREADLKKLYSLVAKGTVVIISP
ncbi:L,D-transpeptidase family protein [Luteolibacter arcticus]|uniref:L,D-transpeptidase family protein n=1 Tax=Luteolibacter arcticus TaxID=1581411 RepID=A0ABT3GLQ8_9BACT|nr:L,D-transpeptidase family protein [Luteolibacter arcticus]MCW1924410.1 L,D-transpeptidase family protein [Luteolibacter arcticus]